MTRLVSEILDAAADLIEPEGAWMQGGLRAFSGGRPVCWCVVGAISQVAPASKPEMEARGVLRRHVRTPLPIWNDAPERTQAEVVSKLREAAEKARSEGK